MNHVTYHLTDSVENHLQRYHKINTVSFVFNHELMGQTKDMKGLISHLAARDYRQGLGAVS